MSQIKNRLRQILLDAVDEGLIILGESSRKAIYFHIQNITALKKEDIPSNLEKFAWGLEKIFGEGAKVIERAIIKSLCHKLGVNYEGNENGTFTFADSVNRIIDMANLKRKGI
ncbi:MAG: hypothetical protein QXZ25_03635 [Candidatus Bathyarchaeia archaeon]